MFNSGQSCCAVERVYVHESIYDKFVEEVVKVVKVRVEAFLIRPECLLDTAADQQELTTAQGYKLGDPRQDDTTLGPVISLRSAATIREHVSEAGAALARTSLPCVLS